MHRQKRINRFTQKSETSQIFIAGHRHTLKIAARNK